MVYGLQDIVWPKVSKNYHYFNTLSIDKNLNIENNFNIKFNLTTKDLLIKNNGFFKSNINVDNYIVKVFDTLEADSIYLQNTHFVAQENTSAGTVNIHLKNLATKFTVENNIDISGNVNLGLFSVARNINCQKNLNINKTLILENNLNNNFNLNVENVYHKVRFNLTNSLDLNNTFVKENLNVHTNLNLPSLEVNDVLLIKENAICKNGVVVLPEEYKLDELGTVGFNSNTNNIFANCNNDALVLNDSRGCENKSSIHINDSTDYIHINNRHIKSIDVFKNNINLYYISNLVGNINIKKNAIIDGNSTLNNYLYFNNNIQQFDGSLRLPLSENTYKLGSFRYNNNTNKIQVFYNSNKWENLKFTDTNNTSIDYDDDNIYFNIKNNNIITCNNTTNIHNLTNVLHNLNVSDSLTIANNIFSTSNINVDNIPFQFYRNLIRSYNHKTNKWTSITLEELNSYYRTPYKTTPFYSNNIKDKYSDLNTIQYINYENTIINNYTLFNNEIITTDLLYLSHIYINLHNKNPNTYNIQIYKNGSVMEELKFENTDSINNVFEFANHHIYNKNDVLKIKIKSAVSDMNDVIIINLTGYSHKIIETKGDSNYYTDSFVHFNKNTAFNVNVTFHNNINVNDRLTSDENTLVNFEKISIKKDLFSTDNIFEINDNFILDKYGKININTKNNVKGYQKNSLINVYSENTSELGFENTGSMSILSDLICPDIVTDTINIKNDVDTSTVITNEIPKYNLNVDNSLNFIDTIHFNANGILNLTNTSSLVTNKLFVPPYNVNTYNTLNVPNIRKMYLYENNNNLCKIVYDNTTTSKLHYIHHNKIDNKNDIIDIDNNTINISRTSIGFFGNTNNRFNININHSASSYLSILDNGDTTFNSTLYLNNTNINETFKELLYTIYGPKDPIYEYDFKESNIVKMYNNENYMGHVLYNTFTISSSDIQTTNIDNILYDSLLVKPTYNIEDYNIELDIVYFTEIILIDPTLRTFENNIESFKVNNPYNYTISVYFEMIDTIYPEYTVNKNGITYINYGLKTEIM